MKEYFDKLYKDSKETFYKQVKTSLINKEKKETTKITQDTIIFKPIKNNQETNIVKSPQINKKENTKKR